MSFNCTVKKQARTPARLAIMAAMTLAGCGTDQRAATATLAAQATGQHTEALSEGDCNLDGTWAIKITVPVRWNGTMALASGEGELTQYVRAKRVRDGDVMRESLTVCGTALPDYRPRLWGLTFSTRFPNSLFDDGHVAPIEVSSHFSGFGPGATFSTDPVVSQMGVSLPDALTYPWPDSGVDLSDHAVDGDQNGHPGVTLEAASGHGYSLPPTNIYGGNTATKFYAAIRNVAHINGTQHTCDRATGEATIPEIEDENEEPKLALDAHILGCELSAGGQCDARQTALLDDNQPVYLLPHANTRGTVTMVRTSDDASCEAVRNFDY